MKATERMYNFFKGKEIDRLPMLEWAPIWDLTYQRWMNEGLNIPFTYFARDWRKVQLELGLDANFQTYFPARTPGVCPVATTHGAGLAKNEAEYEKLKQYMFADPERYISKEHLQWLKETREAGDTVHWFTIEGFFWHPREIFGIEDHLYSFYDEPELYHRMCEDYVEWIKKVVEFIGNTFRFDYMSIAEASDTPVILYNVPSRTGVNLGINLLSRLGEHPNIVALKEASDSVDRLVALSALSDSIALYAGNDSQIYPTLSLGGMGVISVVSNLFPQAISKLCRDYFEEKHAESLKTQFSLLPLISALFAETNPSPVKYLMSRLGLCKDEVRLPLGVPRDSTKALLDEKLSEAMAQFG